MFSLTIFKILEETQGSKLTQNNANFGNKANKPIITTMAVNLGFHAIIFTVGKKRATIILDIKLTCATKKIVITIFAKIITMNKNVVL